MNGVAYIGSDDQNVYAINATTGAEIWRFPTGGAVTTSPAVVNGVVYFGSDDGTLYAVKATTGAVKWSRFIVAEIVKHHGGTITVDSAVGKGSTFTVTLPKKRDTLA